jgi:hypothetical protein
MTKPLASHVRFGRTTLLCTLVGAFAFAAASCGSSGGTGTGAGGAGGVAGPGGAGGTTASGGSGPGGTSAAGGRGGAGGTVAVGGASGAGEAGTNGTAGVNGGAGTSGGGGEGGAAGRANGGAGGRGGTGAGGTSAAGTGGTAAGGRGGANGGAGGTTAAGGAGGMSAKNFTCNTVLGIDSTSEWYTSGFETHVVDAKWQLIYNHPGYVEDWESATDAVYSKAPTSPCAANSNNPDRVILNVFADPSGTLTTTSTMATALTTAVNTIKSKYSRLKRLDLLTMSRGPNNQQCFSSANTVVAQYVDDAIAQVVAANPGLVTASPKFYVTNCSDFDSTNPPHLSTAGMTNMATVYGNYYSSEP